MNPEKLKAWAESRSDWDYVLVKPQDILSLTTLHAAQVAECSELKKSMLHSLAKKEFERLLK